MIFINPACIIDFMFQVQEEDIFATEKHEPSKRKMSLLWRAAEVITITAVVLLISFIIRKAIGSKYLQPDHHWNHRKSSLGVIFFDVVLPPWSSRVEICNKIISWIGKIPIEDTLGKFLTICGYEEFGQFGSLSCTLPVLLVNTSRS